MVLFLLLRGPFADFKSASEVVFFIKSQNYLRVLFYQDIQSRNGVTVVCDGFIMSSDCITVDSNSIGKGVTIVCDSIAEIINSITIISDVVVNGVAVYTNAIL